MEIKTKHGGKRPNSGPKPNDATRKKMVSFRADPNIFEWLKKKKSAPGGMAGVIEKGLLLMMNKNKIPITQAGHGPMVGEILLTETLIATIISNAMTNRVSPRIYPAINMSSKSIISFELGYDPASPE